MQRRMRRLGGLIGLTAAATVALPATAAAEPTGDPFELAREAVSDPEVASVRANRALAAWGTGGDPAFRALSSTGTVGERRQATAGGRTFETGGRIAANPRLDEYLHVWSALSDDPVPEATLYAQRRDIQGRPLADPLILHQVEGAGIAVRDLAWNQRARRFVLLWTVTDDEPSGLSAMLLDEAGARLSSEPLDVEGNASSGGVAVRPGDAGYLVTWSDGRFNESGDRYRMVIRAQRLDDVGRRSGNPVRVSAHSNLLNLVQNDQPSIALDPATGEGIVVWTDQYEVFGRRLGADGAPTGDDLRLSRMGPPSDPAWLTRSPDIAYGAEAQQYVVVWQSGPGRDPYPAGEVVYGQHLDRSGAQIGANDFPIATRERAVEPSITAMAGGGAEFLAVWSSRLDPPGAWARRITPTTLGPPVTLPEDDPTPDQPPVTQPTPGPTGTPVTTPPPAATPQGGAPTRVRFDLRVLRNQEMRLFTRRGIRAAVYCPAACRATVRLRISRRDARRLSTSRTLVRKTARIAAAGSATLTLRAPAEVRRRLRSQDRLKARLVVEAVDARGVVRRLVRRVRFER